MAKLDRQCLLEADRLQSEFYQKQVVGAEKDKAVTPNSALLC